MRAVTPSPLEERPAGVSHMVLAAVSCALQAPVLEAAELAEAREEAVDERRLKLSGPMTSAEQRQLVCDWLDVMKEENPIALYLGTGTTFVLLGAMAWNIAKALWKSRKELRNVLIIGMAQVALIFALFSAPLSLVVSRAVYCDGAAAPISATQ
eukprot:Blabericola_migrator_1__3494@NODE_2035_length_3384_cov_95_542358_g1292_i0_p3_GENE_NODE_2035_length_3384_cov_95_542358_g1292_i0NODE_2035_length_3384_cov_95_542358_g1292_i0_p3_ORF_typecomplete_len154_score21_05DsbD/PF02683_15/0_005DUF4093/PF13331_6/0_15DUF4093/PF13331_6/5_3e03_NODE_2035_length_3384_cov_95_542358_g1292_i056517